MGAPEAAEPESSPKFAIHPVGISRCIILFKPTGQRQQGVCSIPRNINIIIPKVPKGVEVGSRGFCRISTGLPLGSLGFAAFLLGSQWVPLVFAVFLLGPGLGPQWVPLVFAAFLLGPKKGAF